VYGNVTALNRTGADASRDDVLITTYEPTYKLFPIQQSKSITEPNGTVQSWSETGEYYGANGAALNNGRAYWRLAGGALWGEWALHAAVVR
jgi:hypothetical protein